MLEMETELTLDDDHASLLADIQPCWMQQSTRDNCSKSTSTHSLHLKDAAVQTAERHDAGSQAGISERGNSSGQRARAEPHMQAFLQLTAPRMLAALSSNQESTRNTPVLHNMMSMTTKQEDPPQCMCTWTAFLSSGLLQQTSVSGSAGSSRQYGTGTGRANVHRLQVTSLSWSKTGATLAASFGRYDITSWCTLPGAVATWNISRLDASAADTSHGACRLLEVQSCVMCCAFHPAEQALLAGGTYNGELVIWDLSKDDAMAQVAKTDVLSDLRHREAITAISWQHSGKEACGRGGEASAQYRLFSLGADGKLLVWLWDQLSNPVYGYELRLPQMGRGPSACLGGSCMAFCPASSAYDEAPVVLVGTECGQLLRCQVNDINAASLKDFSSRLAAAETASPGGLDSTMELRNAVRAAIKLPVAAPITAVSACPHHRQLAVAAAGDGSLHVVDVLRSEPLMLLEPTVGALLAASWSPSRPLVFAAASETCVHAYDLGAKQRIVQPMMQFGLDSRTSSSGSGINAMAFNALIPGVLATAAGDCVRLWQLPRRLFEPRVGENKLLRRLVDSEDVLALLRAQCVVAT